ncbi:substrate-binding domain-containing protein [Bacillus paralicheniformis]|uniref:LacI family DNA-binding transcriptional regulator n=1 Tax=Bacillus paralicheniformis TaxID=1648923 RepID=UPI0013EF2F07|nr:LacI family DNA-binding transcriptional regulator [Bacillus paralicheniformis]QII49215.1 substrate-binding domain-containing protein [Bacillus paralicheniformis]
MTVTIKDIAHAAGVSYSTVSKALRNSPLVKPDTKKKVLQVAEQLGYTPNFAARSLASKKSQTIGLVWPTIERIALSALVTKINEVVEKNSYSMILSVNKAKEAVELFKSFRVDGIMVFEEGGETQLSDAAGLTIPILSYGVSGEHTHPIIDVNHKKAIYKAVTYLYQLGHKNISYVGDLSPADKRQIEKSKGFEEVMIEAGLKLSRNSILNTNGLSWYNGYTAAKKLLQQTTKPTAIISGSYDISVGILRAVKEQQLRIPEDLSLISYDNIPQMASLETPLTSVGVPIDQLAHKMVDSLLSLIREPGSIPLTQKMDPELNIRMSCASPAVLGKENK